MENNCTLTVYFKQGEPRSWHGTKFDTTAEAHGNFLIVYNGGKMYYFPSGDIERVEQTMDVPINDGSTPHTEAQ